ncbi:hypothetical protein OH491_03070 [Termitidicoccus mucosus]
MLLAGVLLAGCSSYKASVEPGRNLAGYSRVWVKSNMNDNRGLGGFITSTLAAQGYEVGVGPLTMMPVRTQLIVQYRDSWTWDFKDHMTALEITVLDARTEQQIARADYSNPASMSRHPSEVAERLVKQLFAPSTGEMK